MRAVIGLLLFAGCAPLLEVRREAIALADLVEVRGVLRAGAIDNGRSPIVVVLLREDRRRDEVASTFVTYKPGPFHFVAERGRYRVFAFVDRDADLTWDRGEPAGVYGDPGGVPQAGLLADPLEVELVPWDSERLRTVQLEPPASLEPAEALVLRRGQVAMLSEERFGRAMGAKGEWKPRDFLQETGNGLYLLEPWDAAKLPVVFVHGIGGCPQDFTAAIASLDRKRFQPLIFHYASGLRLSASAQALRRALDEVDVLLGLDRVAVVAFSIGGLVAREALRLAAGDDRWRAVSLVTLSTPWGGAEDAATGVRANQLVLPVWLDLVPDSPFLAGVVSPLPRVRHHLFFSYQGGEVDHRNGDGAVTLESELVPAVQRGAVEVFGFRETHDSMLGSVAVLAKVNEALDQAAAQR